MKKTRKIIIAVLFALSVWNVSAQESEYYHIGDTINGRSPIYYYQWWSEAWLADTSHRLAAYLNHSYAPGLIHGEYLQYYYTDVPLQIIGIATSCRTYSYYTSVYDWGRNPLYPEYVRLYDASEDSFSLLEEKQYDRNTPNRYMNLNTRTHFDGISNTCCYWYCPDQIKTIEIREYYFDKPVTVNDSFYVGHTTENMYWRNLNIFADTIDSKLITPIAYFLFWDENGVEIPPFCSHLCGSTPNHLKKYRSIEWQTDPVLPNYGDTIDSTRVWHWIEDPYYMLEFPIVVIDSSYIRHYQCPPVTNLRIANLGEGTAVLYWDTHQDHNLWQTGYGPQGTPPDSCLLINNPMQVASITGLDSCTHYDAYVRGVCYHDSTCYSDWAGPIDIYICDTTGNGGGNGGDSLHTVTALSVLTNIIPNPATLQATVYSSFQINHISAVDANGRMVLDTPMSGYAASFDVKGWTPGLYFVIVHTPVGKVAKKLVVK